MFQRRSVGHLRNVVTQREDNPVDLGTYLRMLSKNWWIIVAGTLAGLLMGVGASALMTPRYEATTTLFVSVHASDDDGTGGLFQAASFAETAVRSYVDIATTAIVLDEVVQELDGRYSRGQLQELLTVSSPGGSVLINISANHEEPETAALLATTVGEVLVDVVENDIQGSEDGQSSPVQIRTVDPGVVPEESVSPNMLLNNVLGIMTGFVIGVGLAVLRGRLDTRIHEVSEVEELTSIPVVGRIANDDQITQRPLVVHDDSRSPRAEAFRTLRTNLQFLAHQDDSRTFVVSSPTPGDGKTHVVANLAVVLAQSGASVVLVEADLRRPMLSKVMGIEGAVGLSDVLIERATLGDVLQPWGTDSLTVLPAGQIPPNPSELLGSSEMQELLNELSEMADYVLIDAPPILPVTDAAILTTFATGTLLVSSSGLTKRQDIIQAIEALENVDGQILGLIVNRIPLRRSETAAYDAKHSTNQDNTSQSRRSA